jgi:hypothetical protein
MGFLPAPPFGQLRPPAVIDKVGFTVDKIRAAGKVAGTLVTAGGLPYGLEKGLQFFYVHSAPFLRLGTERYQDVARAVSFCPRSQHEVAKWHLNFSS